MEIKQAEWRGFDGIGEKIESGGFSHPPERGGWLYWCDGLPTPMGCGESVVVPRRWSRIGTKKSGWLVCYGLEPKPESGDQAEFANPDHWQEDHDVVLTYCSRCADVVRGQSAGKR